MNTKLFCLTGVSRRISRYWCVEVFCNRCGHHWLESIEWKE